MNTKLLKDQEERFLARYPGGFQNPEILQIAKKHNVARLTALIQDELGPEAFEDPDTALELVGKVISRSSLVSVFEKTAFRNHLSGIPALERAGLADGFRELLHGSQEAGFEQLVNQLAPYKLAKWTIITALLYCQDPQKELVIKPSTVKAAIGTFGLEDVQYTTRPNYEFYRKYRDHIQGMKQTVGEELQVENGAFCGFLMFAVGLFGED